MHEQWTDEQWSLIKWTMVSDQRSLNEYSDLWLNEQWSLLNYYCCCIKWTVVSFPMITERKVWMLIESRGCAYLTRVGPTLARITTIVILLEAILAVNIAHGLWTDVIVNHFCWKEINKIQCRHLCSEYCILNPVKVVVTLWQKKVFADVMTSPVECLDHLDFSASNVQLSSSPAHRPRQPTVSVVPLLSGSLGNRALKLTINGP